MRARNWLLGAAIAAGVGAAIGASSPEAPPPPPTGGSAPKLGTDPNDHPQASCMEVMTPHLLALSRLKVVLNRARVTAQGEGAKNASAKIDEAIAIVNDDHDEIHAQAAKLVAKGDPPRVCPICSKQLGREPKVNNRLCPFGHPIDPMSVSDTLVLNYGGKKVGFCCPHCLADWKKLNDEGKQSKLKLAMTEK